MPSAKPPEGAQLIVTESQAKEIALYAFAKSSLELAAHDGDAWPADVDLPEIYNAPEGFPRGHWIGDS